LYAKKIEQDGTWNEATDIFNPRGLNKKSFDFINTETEGTMRWFLCYIEKSIVGEYEFTALLNNNKVISKGKLSITE
jgi:hypothetical protein